MAAVADLIKSVTRHSGLPASRVRQVARRLQDGGLLPISPNAKNPIKVGIYAVVDLIVALLTDEKLHAVGQRTEQVLAYSHTDANGETVRAGDYLDRMFSNLDRLVLPMADETLGALRTSVSLVAGGRPALVLREAGPDGVAAERALTPDGKPWRPELTVHCQKAMSISGFAVMRILMDLGLTKTHRTFPATFEVKA